MEILRYAHENGCPWNARTWVAALKNCNIECLEYDLTNGCPPKSYPDGVTNYNLFNKRY